MSSYTIEYVDGPRQVVAPVFFADKESALANACALLRAGISVSKVTGPGFEMSRTALAAYDQSRRGRRSAA
jgi:hypothetical protein